MPNLQQMTLGSSEFCSFLIIPKKDQFSHFVLNSRFNWYIISLYTDGRQKLAFASRLRETAML